MNRYHQSPLLFIITWFSPLTKQIPSVSIVIHYHMVQPSHWTDTISILHNQSHDSALPLNRYHRPWGLNHVINYEGDRWYPFSGHYSSSNGSALSLTRYHQSHVSFIINNMVQYSHLTDTISILHQIRSVSFIINHIVQTYHWPDTISLLHY